MDHQSIFYWYFRWIKDGGGLVNNVRSLNSLAKIDFDCIKVVLALKLKVLKW